MKKLLKILNNLGFVVEYIWQWDKSILLICALNSIVIATAPFVWIFAPKMLIDELLNGKSIKNIGIILICTFIIAGILNFFKAYFPGVYKMKISNIRFNFIDLMHIKAMTMDFKHTEDPKVLNDIQQAWKTLSSPYGGVGGILQKLFTMFGYLFGVIGYISIIVTLNPLILLYLLINVIIIYNITVKINKYVKSKEPIVSDYYRKSYYTSNTMSDFKYGKDIRIYTMKKFLMSKKNSFDEQLLNVSKDIEKKRFKFSFIDSALYLIREGIVYFYLVYEVLMGSLTISNFTMYSVTIAGFASCMENFMKDFADMKLFCLYVSDLRDFLNIKDDDKTEKKSEIPLNKPYEIQFKNVSFKYPNAERFIYENLSFKIEPGQKLAIVGVNGAGKTTLVKLISRLYKPTKGEILLNGINIWELDSKEYQKLLSVVFQDINIYAFTVAENISLSCEDSNEKYLSEVSARAGIKEKIDSLEAGFNTNMLKILDDNGIELSGGENQKLALARALYKDGDIIILDEPTAALDPISEEKIYLSFNDLIGGKTAVYISHRLSSTRFCDKIAFFENGKIEEYGSHDELMKLSGKYAEMFNIQAQYYKEDIAVEV